MDTKDWVATKNDEGFVVGQYVVTRDTVAFRYKDSLHYATDAELRQLMKLGYSKADPTSEGRGLLLMEKSKFDSVVTKHEV